jgi:hypothetical protein
LDISPQTSIAMLCFWTGELCFFEKCWVCKRVWKMKCFEI